MTINNQTKKKKFLVRKRKMNKVSKKHTHTHTTCNELNFELLSFIKIQKNEKLCRKSEKGAVFV